MSGDTDDHDDNTETVFMPSRPPTTGPAPAAATPAEPTPADAAPVEAAPPLSAPPTTSASAAALAAASSEAPPGKVSIGDVLNGIYEVKRLIGRGGMGEVYEGVNINSDERVAIKVMLPSLAADPKVQAMFRKEARTLTRLAHPALVQYRVLAHEPILHVLYIVTEFVDGVELTAVLGQIHPTSSELKSLIRRLADGLRAAHELGAVHRDISPDNILLPDRRLDRARIIDFGIAKDLDPSKATIVGDGFAGKLAYVAPEQFGDFGREIGPWTDIYSLGLVIMAVATGKDVDMGSTLVEAVDRRRQGIDLTPLHEDLRPLLERMLAADPAKRFRSMDEVLAMLDEQGRPPTIPPATSFPRETSSPPTTSMPPVTMPPLAATSAPVGAAAAPVGPTSFPTGQTAYPAGPTSFPTGQTAYPAGQTSFPAGTMPPHAVTTPPSSVQGLPRPVSPTAKGGSPVWAVVLIGLVTVVVAVSAVGYVMMQQKPTPKLVTPAGNATTPAGPAVATAPPTSVGQAIDTELTDLSCSWLDVVGPVQNGQPLRLSGAAGSPATVQDSVSDAAREAGDNLTSDAVDISAVAQADQGACSALDAFRSFKAPAGSGPALASAQPAYQITRGADGRLAGDPIITVAPRSPAQDFALLRLETNGRLSVIWGSRTAFEAMSKGNPSVVDQGGDAYTVRSEALNAPGATGLLLLTGNGPFDPGLLAKPPNARDVSWIDQVRKAATAGGWKASMVWYKVQGGAPPPAVPVHPRQPRQQQPNETYSHPDEVETVPIRNYDGPVRTQPPPGYPPLNRRQTMWQRRFGEGGATH